MNIAQIFHKPHRDVEVVLLAIPTLNHQKKLRDLENATKKAGVSDIMITSRTSTSSTGRISTCAIWRRSASRICSAGKALPFPMGPIFCYTGPEDDSNKTDNPQRGR